MSTNISVDKTVNRLAIEYGDFAVLLYTWMIPHAEEDATLSGDPEELLFTVIPGRRDKTVDDVLEALNGMESLGLIEWDRRQALIGFPPESFYSYQSNVQAARRRSVPLSALNTTEHHETPPNATGHHQTPENTASVSPSVSVSSSTSSVPAEVSAAEEPNDDDFDLSETDRYVIECIKAVRGMANVPAVEIRAHLIEVFTNRGSPLPELVLRQEAMKFRDFWNGKRQSRPVNERWRGWKQAVTNWFSRAGSKTTTQGREPYDPNQGLDDFKSYMHEIEGWHELRDVRQADAPAEFDLPPERACAAGPD